MFPRGDVVGRPRSKFSDNLFNNTNTNMQYDTMILIFSCLTALSMVMSIANLVFFYLRPSKDVWTFMFQRIMFGSSLVYHTSRAIISYSGKPYVGRPLADYNQIFTWTIFGTFLAAESMIMSAGAILYTLCARLRQREPNHNAERFFLSLIIINALVKIALFASIMPDYLRKCL